MLIASVCLPPAATAQGLTDSPTIPLATAAARLEQRQQQERKIRPENFDLGRLPVSDTNERHWRTVLWTAAVVEPDVDFVAEALAQILQLTARSGLSPAQQRTVNMAMQVGSQLYLANPSTYSPVGQQLANTLSQSQNPLWVAQSLSTLGKAGSDPQQRQQWSSLVQQRFPRWEQNILLATTLRELAQRDNPTPLPSVADLLNWTIAPGELQMYVFCPPDRTQLCQSFLRNPQGQFLRQGEQLWSVPLLLRSIHQLSSVFNRGETPQGIYRIEGTIPQPDLQFFRAYGQFPLVNLFVPGEPGVRQFLPGQVGQLPPTLSAYQMLLPPSWRDYPPVQQSFWAGRTGRGLFRIHGSGEAVGFFRNNNRFAAASRDWNPTIGCLSALEVYDEAGRLVRSDMPSILSALTTVGGTNFTGYLIVVEVPSTVDIPAEIATLEKVGQPPRTTGLGQPSVNVAPPSQD